MKIVVAQHQSLPHMNEIAATLISVDNLQIFAWLPASKPTFDMLEEIRPDIIICHNSMLSYAMVNGVREYNVKLIVFGMCPVDIPNVALVCLDDTTPQHIFKNASTHTVYPFKTAANVAQFNNLVYDQKYASDILYLSNTNISNKQYILDTLFELLSLDKYKIKIAGMFRMPMSEYIGMPTLAQVRSLMSSTKIVLDFDNEIIYDCAISKIFCLSNIQQNICQFYVSDNILQTIEHFINNNKHRNVFIQSAYKKIINTDTYFHRMADIFKLIGKDDLSQDTLKALERLRWYNLVY